jgi:hypothetical protein
MFPDVVPAGSPERSNCSSAVLVLLTFRLTVEPKFEPGAPELI